MDFVGFSINKPVVVLVGVILLILFGIIGLMGLPYQLSPTVIEPEITVTTTWDGATPYEVEREIIEEQEKVLKGIPGLLEMKSQSYSGMGEINLKFRIGTDVDGALLRVSNKLDEVPSYPINVDKPIMTATGAATSPVIWMFLKALPGNESHIYTYRTYFENEVRQFLERVEGVADLFVFAGTEKEMQVIVDPEKLAAHKLTIIDVIRVLQSENANVSSGNMDLGRREIRIRTVGEFSGPEDIESVVITSTGQRRITVGDVARARFGYEKRETAMLHNNHPGIVCGVKPEPGTNILELTDKMELVVNKINKEKLKPQGLYIDWVYDQRPYIRGAIDLVKKNILIGGILAILVLLIFLQSISSTIVVAVAIPISIIGTFIFMNAFGRNLNVISLAGISFAVGMLVDNAIVVLENIDRHRNMGKSSFRAAYDGAMEVWGAVLASTATTVAVFLPVVFIEKEAGQLFKDIAIAVTCAIIISLFVSVSVIPMLSRQLFALFGRKKRNDRPSIITRLGRSLSSLIMRLVQLAIKNWFTRVVTVGFLTAFSVTSAYTLFPKMEYLPQGNRNLVFSFLIPPPGISYQDKKEIGQYLMKAGEKHIGREVDGLPGILNFFYVGSPRINIVGATSTDLRRPAELLPFLTRLMNTIPGYFGVSFQSGIFETEFGAGRAIDVDLSGGEIQKLVAAAGAMYGTMFQAIPGCQIRPIPSLELTFPEIKFHPDRDRLKAVGMSAEELGIMLDVLMDGRKISEFKKEGEKKIDLVLKASEKDIATPEELYETLLVTPGGRYVPVSSLSRLERTSGMTEILHRERQRTITLRVTPPPDVPLEQAMETISMGIIPKLKDGPLQGINVAMSGAADKLTETRKALQSNFLLAVVIVYLLMSALFGNFLYPLIILFTVPLAAAGGVLGFKLENIFIVAQPMDVLTMLGFVILIGVVVNNAILIVHQSLNNIRLHGIEPGKAVIESVRSRIRPIFMSACTSIFGMLPLAVAPGPGSELYRGLGSVVLGGLALSTVFTVFVTPSLLMFFIGMEKPKGDEIA
jgi:HAE1 family hydrophobic/amphiphilic exporter-1